MGDIPGCGPGGDYLEGRPMPYEGEVKEAMGDEAGAGNDAAGMDIFQIFIHGIPGYGESLRKLLPDGDDHPVASLLHIYPRYSAHGHGIRILGGAQILITPPGVPLTFYDLIPEPHRPRKHISSVHAFKPQDRPSV